MGKRKSSRKPITKVKARLPTIFDCVYCSHEKAVEVEMNKQKMTGTVRCRVCQASWTTTIHSLSAPIDVYSDWIDACDLAASKATGAGQGRPGAAGAGGVASDEDDGYTYAQDHYGRGGRNNEYEDDEEDDFIDRRDDNDDEHAARASAAGAGAGAGAARRRLAPRRQAVYEEDPEDFDAAVQDLLEESLG